MARAAQVQESVTEDQINEQMQATLKLLTEFTAQLDVEAVDLHGRAWTGEFAGFNCFGTAGTFGSITGCAGTAGTFGCMGVQEAKIETRR